MSAERFTLDTNILVYSVDTKAGLRRDIAIALIRRAATRDCRLTFQAVGEFVAVTTRKGMMPRHEAHAQAMDWLSLFPGLPTTADSMRNALDLSLAGLASFWDALLVTAAGAGGCTIVFSEDMHDTGLVGGVRICNPFGVDGLSATADALLDAS